MDDFNTKGTRESSASHDASMPFGSGYDKANEIQPWKRPLSSMSPMFILKEGKLHVVIGASGGTHIITAILQILERLIVQGDGVLRALSRPRFESRFIPDILFYENYTALGTLDFRPNASALEYLEDKV